MALDLDLFRLQVFVTVVDRRGYSAAARHLHLAQSTVSHHVSELERTCGESLLRYEDRTVRLTVAGTEVYRSAQQLLSEQDRLATALTDLRVGRGGRVRIGASMAFEQPFFVNDVIAPFCRSHPETLLSLRFGHSRRQAQAVADRELDLAYLIRWDLPDDIAFEHLHDAELIFIAAQDHPLVGREKVSIAEVEAAGLITAPLAGQESYYYRKVLQERGLSGDHSRLEVDGQQARVMFAAAGVGVIATFVPSTVAVSALGGVAPIDVEGPKVTVELGLVRRPGEPLDGPAGQLATWIRRVTAA